VPQAKRSVQIGRPLEEVFAFFADSENDPSVAPSRETNQAHRTNRSRRDYRQRIAGPGGVPYLPTSRSPSTSRGRASRSK